MLRSTSTAVRYPDTCDEEEREMGLLSRAAEIIKAKFSALLNRAENPQETLDYSYEKQLESLQNVKRGVADVVFVYMRHTATTENYTLSLLDVDQPRPQA